MVEAIAEVDDILMEMFVESVDEGCNFTPAVLIPALWRACIKGYIAPTLCGASLRCKGVESLPDSIILFFLLRKTEQTVWQ